MKKSRLYIVLVSYIVCHSVANSQINCTVPLPPVLTSVSVHSESGTTELTWTLSPSSNIAAYVVYSYKDGVGMPLDTIWDPTATGYSFATTAPTYYSVSYVVAAHRMPDCTSPLSNALNTIYCSSEIDTCNKKILIKWNRYLDYPKQVLEYEIFVSINDGPLSHLININSNVDSFTMSDFLTDSLYCYVVKAHLEDGTVSFSNKSCLSARMQRPPEWINADNASVNTEGEIDLSFTIDPWSEIYLFKLERKTGPSGTFQEIAQPAFSGGNVLFTDNQAEINIINYYRLSAVNNCNIPVLASNICSNIVLSFEKDGNNIELAWNSYKEWMGRVSSYRLFINSGKGFYEKAVIPPEDTTISIGYQEIMYEVSGYEVCFYISASETDNPHGINGETNSSTVCIAPEEVVTVPNLFTPNNDLVNDLFKPVLSFTPIDYHLVISDRRGNILFETKNYSAEWDGIRNGKVHPEGIYLWFLKLTTPSGRIISRTGTVTIINNR